jgi:hypothetical protein
MAVFSSVISPHLLQWLKQRSTDPVIVTARETEDAASAQRIVNALEAAYKRNDPQLRLAVDEWTRSHVMGPPPFPAVEEKWGSGIRRRNLMMWWAPLSKRFYRPSHESGRDTARLQTIHKMLWKLVLESPDRRDLGAEKWMSKELRTHVDSYLDELNYNRTGSIICTGPKNAFVHAAKVPVFLEDKWLGHHCLPEEDRKRMNAIEWDESLHGRKDGVACVICARHLYGESAGQWMYHIGKMVIGACVCSGGCADVLTNRFTVRFSSV